MCLIIVTAEILYRWVNCELCSLQHYLQTVLRKSLCEHLNCNMLWNELSSWATNIILLWCVSCSSKHDMESLYILWRLMYLIWYVTEVLELYSFFIVKYQSHCHYILLLYCLFVLVGFQSQLHRLRMKQICFIWLITHKPLAGIRRLLRQDLQLLDLTWPLSLE